MGRDYVRGWRAYNVNRTLDDAAVLLEATGCEALVKQFQQEQLINITYSE